MDARSRSEETVRVLCLILSNNNEYLEGAGTITCLYMFCMRNGKCIATLALPRRI